MKIQFKLTYSWHFVRFLNKNLTFCLTEGAIIMFIELPLGQKLNIFPRPGLGCEYNKFNKNVIICFQASLCRHNTTRLGLRQDGRSPRSSQRTFEFRLRPISDLTFLKTIKLERFERLERCHWVGVRVVRNAVLPRPSQTCYTLDQCFSTF